MTTVRTIAVIGCLLAAPATMTAQQRGRETTTERPSPSAWGLEGYSLVLVAGYTQPASGGDAVPPAARKALADMQAFLPYKNYLLLDSEWMLCCTSFGEPVLGKVRGPDGRDYEYTINTTPGDNQKLNVRFTMQESSSSATPARAGARGGGAGMSDTARAEYSRQLYEATKERDEAESTYKQAKTKSDVGLVQQSEAQTAALRLQRAEQRIRDLQTALASEHTSGGGATDRGGIVMNNTFSITIGETVVIGTSRIHGSQALIALLTAAPKPGRKD